MPPARLLRGLARITRNDKWVNGLVYYELDAGLSQDDLDVIDSAIEHWNTSSSITLLQRTDTAVADYIRFEAAGSCASWVGRIGGEQAIWVGPTCTSGSVIHEIGHAIGLFHEHTRADRDDHITVEWANIKTGKTLNFDIVTDGTELIGNYDYGSIMHYGQAYFSRNGENTISVPDGVAVGQRVALSSKDIESVATLYQTDLVLVTNVGRNSNNEVTVDVSVTNQGLMGAHAIQFSLPLPADVLVLSTTGNDWVCSVVEKLLTCDLFQLATGASSELSITLDPAALIPQDNNAWLTAKTHDYELSNNGAEPPPEVFTEVQPGDPYELEPVASENPETKAPPPDTSVAPTPQVEPPVAAAVVTNSSDSANPASAPDTAEQATAVAMSGGASAGGSAGWLSLTGLILLLRRRVLDS